MAHAESARKLWDLIKNIRIGMLTTVHEDGTLHSRPMATQKVEFDGDLWFFTLRNSEKVFDVQKERNVNLSYASPEENCFISVSGRARIRTDRDKAAELWQPMLKAWFPKGLDDPDLALIRVKVDSAEYWDSSAAPIVQAIGFVKALAAGERYHAAENETLDFRRGWLR